MPGTAPMSMAYTPPRQGPYSNVQGQRAMAGQMGVVAGGPQPIGGGMEVELMRGISGFIRSNEAVLQELKEQSQQLRVLNQRTVRTKAPAVGTQSREPTVTITEKELAAMLSGAVIAVVNEASAATNAPWHIPTSPDGTPLPVGASGAPTGAHPARARPPAHQEARRGDGGWAPPSHGQTGQEAEPQMSNWDLYQRGRGYNLGRLRQDVASGVGQRISEAQWTGGIQRAAGPFLPGQEATSGLFTNTRTGGAASAGDIAALARRGKVMGALKGGVGEMMGAEGSVGKGVMSMLPKGLAMGAAKLAGVVGVAKQIGDFATAQREQNAEWQQISGGSNASGFMERARSRRFAMSQFGTMSGENAQELYQGIARTGLRGSQRDQGTAFAVDSYKRFGMAIQESVAMVDHAAKNGATSFGFLTHALTGVTKAARQAGINAADMQRRFVSSMTTLTPTMGVQGAAEMAAGQAIATTGYGRNLASKLDSTAANSDPTQFMMQAAAQGLSSNQMQADLLDPATRGKTAQKMAGNKKQMAGNILGAVGRRLVSNFVTTNGRHPNEAEYDKLASQYLRSPGAVDIVTVIGQIENMMGESGMTQANAIQYLMKTFAGGMTDPSGKFATTDASVAAEQQKQERGTFAVEGGGLSGSQAEKARGQLGMGGGALGLAQMGPGALLAATTGIGRNDSDEQKQAARIYWAEANQTKRAGGVSAALASKTGFSGDRRIRVQTKDGERLVTTDDALRHFRDQVDAGTAMIESGADAGKTVAEAMNMAGDTDLKVTSSTEKGKGKYGKDAEDSGGSKAKVTIEATAELRRLLKFSGTDPNTNLAPPNSRTTPSGLPSDSTKG